ncbi:CHRD domain-containing protein [Sphingomonas sp. CL5.1]|uniref:CHRD domain-containing protein n=1 Tax=Sphingomonas sp. CL5.1 TaxID=2653203 RepID=UPI0015822334|nr:CHRD domain-containing protein [Sphingomonas sp. CL5.1]QKR98371.1 CHRD domain-containing protein [Sphingomonas sp. CL5.1]
MRMSLPAIACMAFLGGPALAAGPVTFTTMLSGPAEVPPAPAAGHGTASVTIDTAKGQLCYELSATGTDTPTMAHVHKGAAGVAGPVVVALNPPAQGSSKGCATAPADTLAAILAEPSSYYVNVHTAKYPKGAMRGQLGK